jgi:hypothetical protein
MGNNSKGVRSEVVKVNPVLAKNGLIMRILTQLT